MTTQSSRDVLIIAALSAVAYLIAIRFDLFEQIYRFVHQHETWELDELILLSFFSSIGLMVYALRRHRELKQQLKTIHRLASTDPLTGTYNRSFITETLQREMARADRHAHPLCVLWLDIDNFKAINDSVGHVAADRLLCDFVSAINHTLRTSDSLGRMGGDEFLVVLPETSEAECHNVGLRILSALHAIPQSGGTHSTSLSASIGLASYLPDESLEHLLARVDHAMYAAKRSGKDRVIEAVSESVPL